MGPIPLVFSRVFKDWHFQWGNGFYQIIWQWLIVSWWFFQQTLMKFWFRLNAEKISLLALLHARARIIRITHIGDFGLFWPKSALFFLSGNFQFCQESVPTLRDQSARIRGQSVAYFVFITLCFVFCVSFLCISILYFLYSVLHSV